MKLRNTLPVVCCALLASCAGKASFVRVIDAKDKLPVYGATVVGVNGNLVSSAVVTNADGVATEPTLPTGVRELVIKKSGYNTKRQPLY